MVIFFKLWICILQDGLELDGKLDFLKTFSNGKGTVFKQLGFKGVDFSFATRRLYCNDIGRVKHFLYK